MICGDAAGRDGRRRCRDDMGTTAAPPRRHYGPAFRVQLAWAFVVSLGSLYMPQFVEAIAVGAIAGMSNKRHPRVIPTTPWILVPAVLLPRGYSADGSRRRRGPDVDIPQTGRGGAAGAT